MHVNRVDHGIQIRHHVIIPESDDTVALALQPLCPNLILGPISFETMLAAVHLYNDFHPMADKIDNVPAQRGLPTKMETLCFFKPQLIP